MNTETFTGRKTRSAVRRSPGSGLAATRYRSPALCTRERTAISGDVSRFRFPCMLLRVAIDVAQEPSGNSGAQAAREARVREDCAIVDHDRPTWHWPQQVIDHLLVAGCQDRSASTSTPRWLPPPTPRSGHNGETVGDYPSASLQ